MGAAYAEIPDIKKDCSICHTSHKMAGYGLKAPVSELCIGCHPDRKAPEEHKVDIVPKMTVSALPLDKEGRINCITCHDPHGKAGFEKMLRAPQKDLCRMCHDK